MKKIIEGITKHFLPFPIIICLISILLPGQYLNLSVQGNQELDRPGDQPVADAEENIIIGEQGEKIYLKEKKIEIDGLISNPTWPLELLACAEGGKDYESLVVMQCRPQTIHLALALFGLKEGLGGPVYFGDLTKPTGDLVLVLMEWEQKSYRAEDLVLDART
ncbi:MAG: hypothetical protein AAB019_07410, partial [Planctomycetota bacterium]